MVMSGNSIETPRHTYESAAMNIADNQEGGVSSYSNGNQG
jgi:hypothetical protein